jgi:hypothetical protein
LDLAAKPLQSNRVSGPRPASFPLKMPIDLTTLTKNNSCVYSCSFLNLTISLEINRFFQSYFSCVKIKMFSFGSARSNREKIRRLTNKTNICPDELSKFLISHRELKRGGCSRFREEAQILRQGRICPSWECYPTLMHPGSIARKARVKFWGSKFWVVIWEL